MEEMAVRDECDQPDVTAAVRARKRKLLPNPTACLDADGVGNPRLARRYVGAAGAACESARQTGRIHVVVEAGGSFVNRGPSPRNAMPRPAGTWADLFLQVFSSSELLQTPSLATNTCPKAHIPERATWLWSTLAPPSQMIISPARGRRPCDRFSPWPVVPQPQFPWREQLPRLRSSSIAASAARSSAGTLVPDRHHPSRRVRCPVAADSPSTREQLRMVVGVVLILVLVLLE